jgi:transcriptional regulator with XRE-family HTH domain
MPTNIEPFYVALGSRIQQAREARKMTQAQLCSSLKPPSTRASIANIENGKQRVLAHTLAQLAESLAVGIEALVPPPAGEQPAKPPSQKEVERELKMKLNLGRSQLKKLTSTLSETHTGDRA